MKTTTINNITELKNFVLTSQTELNNKINVVNECLNIIILGKVKSENELIVIIGKNSRNPYRKIILGNGIKPIND